jgi:peptide-methionine (R)-S-oxide reductase
MNAKPWKKSKYIFLLAAFSVWALIVLTNSNCKQCVFQNLYENAAGVDTNDLEKKDNRMTDKIEKTDEQWRQQLTPEQYRITRKAGTERAFTGQYWNHKENGKYTCICCGAVLFESETKYDSGCGWPSFYQPADTNMISEHEDRSLVRVRTEVRCSKCGAHLGHVFEDGPQPTGLRYCINSASLDFEKEDPNSK